MWRTMACCWQAGAAQGQWGGGDSKRKNKMINARRAGSAADVQCDAAALPADGRANSTTASTPTSLAPCRRPSRRQYAPAARQPGRQRRGGEIWSASISIPCSRPTQARAVVALEGGSEARAMQSSIAAAWRQLGVLHDFHASTAPPRGQDSPEKNDTKKHVHVRMSDGCSTPTRWAGAGLERAPLARLAALACLRGRRTV